MIKQFKFYHAILYSFYNMDFYIDILKNRKGFGFKYLIILSCIISSFWTYHQNNIIQEVIKYFNIQNMSEHNVSDEAKVIINIISQFPDIYIKDGEASIDENLPQPYHIKDDKDNIIAIIDTSLNALPSNILLVISKNQMVVFDQIKDLSMFGNITINQDFIVDGLKKLISLLPLIFIIFALKITFINFFKAIFIAILISIIWDIILAHKIVFQALFRTTIIALTPALLFEMIFLYSSFLPQLRYMNIISYCITIAYMLSVLVKFKEIK